MTDTEILDEVVVVLKLAVTRSRPLSPSMSQEMIDEIDQHRFDARKLVANPTYQAFWRCAHHPEAIANWSHGQGWHCEHGCDIKELRWFDNGTHDNVSVVEQKPPAVCEWVLAQPPKGIAPAAFSWWDCLGRRCYGYPSNMICNECGRELRLVSDAV